MSEHNQQPSPKATTIPILTPLLVAIQFMTQSPAFIRRPFTDKELGRAVGYFPVVGLVLGLVLLLGHTILNLILPAPVVVILLLALWVLMTGALHLDGLLDACDGLFGGFTPESRMEIMRDERIGAFALAGGVLLLLTKFTALQAVIATTPQALLLAPLLGRWTVPLALVAFPYARPKGLGRTMKDQANWGDLAFATIITLGATWWIAGVQGLVAFGLVGLLTLLGGVYVMKKIPGLTGDIYGALCELGETLVLLLLAMEVF